MAEVISSPSSLEARLDLLTEQVGEIAMELRRQRETRERWGELVEELTPVGQAAMDIAVRELDDLSGDVTIEDAVRFLRTTARTLPALEAGLAQVRELSELVTELTSLGGAGMGALTDMLQGLESKGYFGFARQGALIADNVVTSFSEDDVRALGDNIVLILQTVKEMTQPEVMTMLRRTVTAQQVEMPAAPPSTFALLRQMREPEVRRGLARALSMLRTLGEEQASTTPKEGPN